MNINPWLKAGLLSCAIITTAAFADSEESRYVNKLADGKFSINYEALGEATDLSQTEKVLIVDALRERAGYVEAQGTKGITAKCHLNPVGCKVTMDPTATRIMSQAGAFVVTTAICLVVDAADFEVTAPICEFVLEAVVETTIMPVLTQCARKDQSTAIELDFWLIPPKVKANAYCER